MAENPYEPPKALPTKSKHRRTTPVMMTLAALAIPAAAIAGGTTCTAIGTGLYSLEKRAYEVFFLHMIAGGVPAIIVAMTVFAFLRSSDPEQGKIRMGWRVWVSLLIGLPIGAVIGGLSFFGVFLTFPFRGSDVLNCAVAGLVGGALFCLPSLIFAESFLKTAHKRRS